MKQTNVFQKLLPSVINVIAVFIISIPFLVLTDDAMVKKAIVIGIFFLYCFFFQLFNKNEDLGMLVVGTKWKKNYPSKNQTVYNILYTLSFATLFFHKFFVFDLFLANMVLLQLPFVLITGTTFHGYLAGKMVTVN